jgi:hypothetical protein
MDLLKEIFQTEAKIYQTEILEYQKQKKNTISGNYLGMQNILSISLL